MRRIKEIVIGFNRRGPSLALYAVLAGILVLLPYNRASGEATEPPRLVVEDSVAPIDDLKLPFGQIALGQERTEQITLRNVSDTDGVLIEDVILGTEYFEDFSDGEAQGWEPRDPANWSVVDGEYRAMNDPALTLMRSTYTGRTWEDLAYQVTLRRTGGNFSFARMFLRASDDFVPEQTGRAYAVGITGQASFFVTRYSGTESFRLTGDGVIDTPYLNQGEATNVVLFNIEGDQLQVFFNGNLAWSGTDDHITGPGRVGLAPVTVQFAPTRYFFDVVQVTEPLSAAGNAALSASEFRLENVPGVPFSIPPGGEANFDVVYAATREGDHSTLVTILSDDAAETAVEVALSGRALSDLLTAAPDDGFLSAGPMGGPFNPSSQVYTLHNFGDVALDWSADWTASWLDATPSGGTLGAGESVEVTVALNELAAGLQSGQYVDTIVFENLSSGKTRERAVTLDVAVPLSWAVGQPNWTFTTGGHAPWFTQTSVTRDSGIAAQSGSITHRQESWMETEVEGPGELSFWWRVSSEPRYDFLEFHLNDTRQDRIAGGVNWQQKSYTLEEGTHTLRWRYIKDHSVSEGQDAGWVTDLSWTPPDFLRATPVESFASSGFEGGPFDPASKLYTLVNTGDVALDWSADSSAAWLAATPAGGTLAAGESVEVTVNLTAAAEALVPDSYSATLAFTNLTTDYTISREASLRVLPIPGELVVEDSIQPVNDRDMPFGDLLAGQERVEQITLRNVNDTHAIIVENMDILWTADSLVGASATAPTVGGPVATEPVATGTVAVESVALAPVSQKGKSDDKDYKDAEYDPDTFLVGFKAGPSIAAAADRASVHAAMGVQRVRAFRQTSVDVLRVPKGRGLEQVMEAYRKLPEVAYVEPNYRLSISQMPDDPRFGDMWGLHNTGQSGGTPGADIDALNAWAVTTGNSDVIVAVIDTGIDYTHPDLAPNMWVNPNPTFGDIHGATWIGGNGSATSGDPMDDQGHGTHVAGTIGAVGNNGIGVVGVNWNVRLMALKFLNSQGSGATADAIAAIEYAIEQGAHITNNSWGGAPYSQALKDMIDLAAANNQLFVAAAGNNNRDNDALPTYPANYNSPNIISVASSDHNDNRSSFSNWGLTTAHLAAPGSSILSTLPGGSYGANNGTSMAAPHVAGVASLLLGLHPGASYADLKRWLLDGVDQLPQWEDRVISGGRLNAANALLRADPPFMLENLPSFPFSIAPGESVTVDVRFAPSREQLYSGTVVIESNDLDEPVAEVALSGTAYADYLTVSPTGDLVSTGFVGGPFDPPSKVYTLNNVGLDAFDWSAGSAAAWLEATPAGGTLHAGESVEVTVGMSAEAAELPPGQYASTFVFENLSSNSVRERAAGLEIRVPLPQAIGQPDWTVTSIGNAAWFGQGVVTPDGGVAAQSGSITHNQQTWLETQVEGPGVLSFWWKVSSEANFDFLEFYINGARQDRISGEVDWEQKSFTLEEEGMNSLRWRYIKDFSISLGQDAGWVADVEWVPADDLRLIPAGNFVASGYEGGPFDPSSKVYTLTNAGDSALDWTADWSVTWLEATPASGTLTPGESIEVTVNLTTAAAALEPDAYADTLVFTNLMTERTGEREISLTVLPIPGELVVEDSIPLIDDRQMPFGQLLVGQDRVEHITLHNVDDTHDLIVGDIYFTWNTGADVGISSDNQKVSQTLASQTLANEPLASEPLAQKGKAADNNAAYDPDTFLVGFTSGEFKKAEDRVAVHSAMGVQRLHAYRLAAIDVMQVPEGQDLYKLMADYRARPEVAYVEPNYLLQISQEPDDPQFGELWGLHNTGQTGGTPGADIEALNAWAVTTGKSEVIVAVIDTGIDYNHPDLEENMWVNPNPTFGDIHGARWTGGSGAITSGDPMDDQGHGTHVAGTIGAVGDNGIGIAGVNWKVQLMALKFLGATGGGRTADAISALEYAIEHGAHITNNSWGGGAYSQALRDMIRAAAEANQLFVAAAGNNGRDTDAGTYYPAGYDSPNIIVVASSDHNDDRSDFSNWGVQGVHLAAPGSNILSTVPGGGYDTKSGTSMAAPHVAGVASLLLEQFPGAPFEDVKRWLIDGVDALPQWEDLVISGGRLNAANSLMRANPPFKLENMPSFPFAIGPGQSVTINLRYAPTREGVHDGTVVLESNDADQPEVEVALSATALANNTSLFSEVTFRIPPTPQSPGSIGMVANTPTTDTSGPVEYWFEIIEGTNSSWVSSSSWEFSGLAEGKSYDFRFKVRDAVGNESYWSSTASATASAAGDTTAPSPNPMSFAGPLTVLGENAIAMTATTASDINGVEYQFVCTAGDGPSSGWQASTQFTASGLEPDTTYTYIVRARDGVGNITVDSGPASATTTPPDTTPPSPATMSFATPPTTLGFDAITMTATTASDPSGVEYYFEETSGNPGGSDSGWQDSPTYVDNGLQHGTTYSYRVRARDKSPAQNATDWSPAASATTEVPDTTPPVVISFDPPNGETDVPIGTRLEVTFDEEIVAATGFITLKNLTDGTETAIDITDGSQVSVEGAVLTINPAGNLASTATYAIHIGSTAIEDLSENAFAGIADDTTWSFTTASTTPGIYRWTGAADGDWTNAANWDGNGVPVDFEPGRTGLSFQGSAERIVIDATNNSPTTNVPQLNPSNNNNAATPTVDVIRGSVNFAVTSNLNGNGTIIRANTTTTIGDGNVGNGLSSLTYTFASANQFRRHDNFNMGITVNRDGTLNFESGSLTNVSRDNNKNLHVTLAGGVVNFSGAVRMVSGSDTSTGNSWFDFTAPGSTFTASFGNYFPDLATVNTIIENGFTFRSSTDLDLVATDNGDGTFTVSVAEEPGPGPVDRFEISSIASPQTVGTPITGITITALDASDATATSFTGTVTFGGTGGFSGSSGNFTDGVLTGVSVTPTVSGSDLTFTVDDGSGHTGSTSIATIHPAPSAFDTWATQIPDVNLRGRDDDADGDGFTNLQEFLFGTSPVEPTGSLTTTETSGSDLIIRWKERTVGAQYTLQESNTLDNDWTPSSVVPVNDGSAVDGYQPRKATVPTDQGKMFLRVEALED